MTNPNLDFMVKCGCGWHGSVTALLRAPHPFQEGRVTNGCPGCREVGSLMRLCDEPGCMETQLFAAGNTKDGYRMMCVEHCGEVLAERMAETQTQKRPLTVGCTARGQDMLKFIYFQIGFCVYLKDKDAVILRIRAEEGIESATVPADPDLLDKIGRAFYSIACDIRSDRAAKESA